MSSYLDERLAIDRLKNEYKKHSDLVIGFDFDNTIYDTHKAGISTDKVKTLLRQCSRLDFTMCLYSIISDDGMSEHDKVEYCEDNLINVDYVNNSPVKLGKGKPFFSILLDDRAGLSSSYHILRTALLELNLIK